MKKQRFVFSLIIALSLLALAGCGGGSSSSLVTLPASGDSASKVTITGTAYAPDGATASRSADRTAQANSSGRDVPVSGATVSAYTMKADGSLEAIDIASAVTGSNGKYELKNVPQGENIIILVQKSISSGGNSHTLRLKKCITVDEADIAAGQKSGLNIDAATTLAAAAVADVLATANTGVADSEKITGSQLPGELAATLETEIQTALSADQSDATPAVDLSSVVTGGDTGTAQELQDLENCAHGQQIRTRKQQAATKGNLRVHVVGVEGAGGPIEGATVIITVNGTDSTGTTDDKGNAFFDAIDIGSAVSIQVIKAGYVMKKTSQNIEHAARLHNITVQMIASTENQAPVADAGADQSVLQGATVSLSGAASFDPDGDTLSYSWTQTAGTTVSLSGATTATATFTAGAGSYTFSLTVNDGTVDSAADTVTITALAVSCIQDSDCDDSNALTLDTCSNAGTADSSCSHTTIACNTDADCDDSDDYTADSCSNGGTISAACSHAAIACLTDAECADTNALTIDTCNNPGTAESACANTAFACNTDADCDDSDDHTADSCSNGGTISAACAHDAIACLTDAECDDSNALTINDACTNAGTVNSACTSTPITCNVKADCDDSDITTVDVCFDGGTVQSSCDNITPVTAISSHQGHSCRLTPTGSIECWGWNSEGQLGNEETTDATTTVTVHGITDAISVTTGHQFTCALIAGGKVQCWGNNSYGELGDGTNTNSLTPVTVSGITNAVEINSGYYHACALLDDATVKCWGENANGELGNGTNVASNVPTLVSGLSGVTSIDLSWKHSCALLNDSSAVCWGCNENGQLGNSTTVDSNTPTPVTVVSTMADIAIGGYQTCALDAAGTVKCWGRNHYGQLGNGTETDSITPVSVTGISTATSIVTTYIHSCVELTDGTAKCWGFNHFGQMGNGTDGIKSLTPVTFTVTDFYQYAPGIDHTCFLLQDRTTTVCAGRNLFGQLGNGTLTDSNMPVTVQ